MASKTVPHFRNDIGVHAIQVGAKEFMCIGATPPFDHPHVYLDMGSEDETICQYCSTVFRYRKELGAGACEPAGCLWSEADKAVTPQL